MICARVTTMKRKMKQVLCEVVEAEDITDESKIEIIIILFR